MDKVTVTILPCFLLSSIGTPGCQSVVQGLASVSPWDLPVLGPPQPQGGGRSRLQFAGASYLVPLIPQEPWRHLGQPIGISFSRWESEQLEITHQPSTLVDEPKLRFHTSSHPKAHSPNPKSGVCHCPWDRDTVRGARYPLKQSAGDR